MFQRTVFVLTFESDEVLGYRSGSQGDVLRSLSINLRQGVVEYELMKRGLSPKRRVEHSSSMAHLLEKLPHTVDSFDLKFAGPRRTEEGGAHIRERGAAPADAAKDPWDLTSYFDKSRAGKLGSDTGLKLADDDFK